MRRPFLFSVVLLLGQFHLYGQLQNLEVENLRVKKFVGDRNFSIDLPLVSYVVNGNNFISGEASILEISFTPLQFAPGVKGNVYFKNVSNDTVRLSNVVPFGQSDNHVFISGLGDHRLSRTHLFLPEKKPVNVIVPDNAWELGYSGINLADSINVFALIRRDPTSQQNATLRRFETVLHPGGSVNYYFYSDYYTGEWQEGVRKVFQERSLYDVDSFDAAMYQRNDLKWIRKAYVMHLIMAWDKEFYDDGTGTFNLTSFVARGKKLYGGDDVVCIWPTWPTLGVDQRNQFDMYRDLPGGLKAIRLLADTLRKSGTKFFIAYNPWDESTRSEGHLQGLSDLIRETSADGIVLDTKGESSKELQEAADKIKSGVVMYSEGMAVPKDMPGIVSGRVHNALYYPPMLNLNKLIRPDFAIFRVAEVYKEPIKREYAVSFFNGYGTEINQFAPGHPEYEGKQYEYLGRTSHILRENTENFTNGKFTPLIETLHESIWVNQWETAEKSIYTIFSLKPEGFKGNLFRLESKPGYHVVDLWHHKELKKSEDGYVEIETSSFDKSFLGTNNEGEVDCIGVLPEIITFKLVGNTLSLKASEGTAIKMWAGDPSYSKTPLTLPISVQEISLNEAFDRFEGKFVLQVFDQDELLDEVIFHVLPGTPRVISQKEKTPPENKAPSGMVKIPAGKFVFKTTQGDGFIPYPADGVDQKHEMNSFFMDKFPVTNRQFKAFIESTLYVPRDTANFLKHWVGGAIPKGEENFPVVYISYEDAKTYATWIRKRLPTEIEWQYAAQTPMLQEWPWKQQKPVTRKEQFVTETLTVTLIEGIDPKHTNLGDGKPYAVGSFSKGANPYGLQDLVGCVWHLTNDIYESGSYRYIIMKGGSYFKPSSSWWYVQGGPRELHYRQSLLRVSEGFERNATVGFRCVKDAK
ncbi:MAG: SUMF1/EgtB/PvdO family nonheme iron enzyme [Bacteroidota bacterium]